MYDSATHPDEPVLGLKFLCGVYGVIDQAKSSGLAATKLHHSKHVSIAL